MAGGDGSLATVAAAAAEHDLPFICIPAGTRNHFALDLGMIRHDLLGALDAFTAGVERRIDMAEVNGRPCLNNISLGIYGDAVRSPAYRDAKVRTLLETAAEVMGPAAEALALDLNDDRPRMVVPPSCSCRTTPTRLTARWPAAPARRWTTASSGSSSSTPLATARASRAGHGARRS